jgi:hypothetical protein
LIPINRSAEQALHLGVVHCRVGGLCGIDVPRGPFDLDQRDGRAATNNVVHASIDWWRASREVSMARIMHKNGAHGRNGKALRK